MFDLLREVGAIFFSCALRETGLQRFLSHLLGIYFDKNSNLVH